jgi:hypothetical protein
MYREDVQTLCCRRYPPVSQAFLTPPSVVGGGPGQLHAVHFPKVRGDWACGEHKEKPPIQGMN